MRTAISRHGTVAGIQPAVLRRMFLSLSLLKISKLHVLLLIREQCSKAEIEGGLDMKMVVKRRRYEILK